MGAKRSQASVNSDKDTDGKLLAGMGGSRSNTRTYEIVYDKGVI